MYKQLATKSIDSTSSPYTLETLYHVILVDTSTADVTITLPAVSTLGIVYEVQIIHETGGNTLTINANGADTINDNQASAVSTTAGEAFLLRTVAANQVAIYTNLAAAGGGGGGSLEKEVQFASDLDTVREVTFRGTLTVSAISETAGIDATSVALEVSDDDGATWTSQADVAAVNTWIGANVTGDGSSGTNWRLRLTATYEATITNLQSATILYTR